MLTSLSIRDVVLIDELSLDFQAGLSVLTGETGAGKSILLDSLASPWASGPKHGWSGAKPNKPVSPPCSISPTIIRPAP